MTNRQPSAGGLPFSGTQGQSLFKASSDEFDADWIPPRAPLTALSFTSADFYETPDHASLDLTGSIEVILWAAADDWTPAAVGLLVSKADNAAVTTGGGYEAAIDVAGTISFRISNGTNYRSMVSPTTPTFVNGQPYWLRFAYDNTAKTTAFYFSEQSLATPLPMLRWSTIGTSTAHAGGSPAVNAMALRVGSRPATGGAPFTGVLGRVVVKDGIDGTIVADWRSDAPIGASARYRDQTGKTWTATGSAYAWVTVED